MQEKLRIGIMGCAAIAEKAMIPAIIESPLFELVAVSSRNGSKAVDFATRFNCEAVTGYGNLLQRDDIDAIYMPLPTGLHEEWVIKTLQAGKHIHVEKSFGMDLASTEKMVSLAKERNLLIMENFQFEHHSQQDAVKKILQSGKIGELRSIRASFGFPPLPADNFRWNKALGGGSLLDAGAYMMKVSQFLIEDDLYVDSAYLNYDENGVDLFGGAMVKAKTSPIFAQVAFGFDNFYQCNYELWGSLGRLTVHRAYTAHPHVEPVITLETHEGREDITLPRDNHFINILEYFHRVVQTKEYNEEYKKIVNQSRLIDELKNRSNG